MLVWSWSMRYRYLVFCLFVVLQTHIHTSRPECGIVISYTRYEIYFVNENWVFDMGWTSDKISLLNLIMKIEIFRSSSVGCFFVTLQLICGLISFPFYLQLTVNIRWKILLMRYSSSVLRKMKEKTRQKKYKKNRLGPIYLSIYYWKFSSRFSNA